MKKQNLIAKFHSQSELLTPSNSRYREWILQYTESEMKKDVGRGDITTKACFPKPKRISAYIVAKETGILAGQQEIEFFLVRYRTMRFRFLKRDGNFLKKGDRILMLRGSVHDLMKTERIILNLLGRMSGVATFTHRIVLRTKKINPMVLITPTRKTLWGLLDKRACLFGGAGTHRLSLDSAILIKHNHVRTSGFSLQKFLHNVMLSLPKHDLRRAKFVEIEVCNMPDAIQAAEVFLQYTRRKISAGRFCVMLDNMQPREIRAALAKIKLAGLGRGIIFEASGGINEKNLSAYAKSGVSILSLGILTHSAPMMDFSMRVYA